MYGDYMLDISRGENKDGANVQIYYGYNADSQQFTITKSSKNNGYLIATKVSKGTKVLDIEMAGTTDGSNVLQWVKSENSNQIWVLESTNAPTSTTTIRSTTTIITTTTIKSTTTTVKPTTTTTTVKPTTTTTTVKPTTTTTTVKPTTTTTTTIKKTTTTTTKKTTTTTTKKTTTTTTNKPEPTSTSKRYDIIKEGYSKISSDWGNWSWGVDKNEFNSKGEMVNVITAGSWGAVSFKGYNDIELGSGTLHFKARSNDTSAVLEVYLHPVNDDPFVNVATIKNLSTSKMTEFNINVKELSSGKFNRISIQDGRNKGVTLYLDDFYFVEGSSMDENNSSAVNGK